jgi:hypothetical protein
VRKRQLIYWMMHTRTHITEQFDEASKLAASGSNEGLKKISQDQQLKLYGWFKQVQCYFFLLRSPRMTRAAV